MTLRVLLNNVTHIIRLSSLLKFSSRHKIFNFSNCPNGIAMCFCQPLYIRKKENFWVKLVTWFCIISFVHRKRNDLLCHSSRLNVFITFLFCLDIIAVSLCHGTCLADKWLSFHSTFFSTVDDKFTFCVVLREWK